MGSDSSTSTSPPPPRPAQHHHVHRRHLRVCFPLELQRVAYRRRCPRRECSQDGGRQARPRGDPGRGLAIRVPPQVWWKLLPLLYCRDTCQGKLLSRTLSPPTTLVRVGGKVGTPHP